MSRQKIAALLELQKTVKKNLPMVKKKFAEAGIPADPALVFSTAQYYDALKKACQDVAVFSGLPLITSNTSMMTYYRSHGRE